MNANGSAYRSDYTIEELLQQRPNLDSGICELLGIMMSAATICRNRPGHKGRKLRWIIAPSKGGTYIGFYGVPRETPEVDWPEQVQEWAQYSEWDYVRADGCFVHGWSDDGGITKHETVTPPAPWDVS